MKSISKDYLANRNNMDLTKLDPNVDAGEKVEVHRHYLKCSIILDINLSKINIALHYMSS